MAKSRRTKLLFDICDTYSWAKEQDIFLLDPNMGSVMGNACVYMQDAHSVTGEGDDIRLIVDC